MAILESKRTRRKMKVGERGGGRKQAFRGPSQRKCVRKITYLVTSKKGLTFSENTSKLRRTHIEFGHFQARVKKNTTRIRKQRHRYNTRDSLRLVYPPNKKPCSGFPSLAVLSEEGIKLKGARERLGEGFAVIRSIERSSTSSTLPGSEHGAHTQGKQQLV